MRNSLLLVLAFFTGYISSAQKICYSTEVINQRRTADPAYDKAAHDAELALQKWVQTNQQDPYYSARTVRTIPVVVHVIYNSNAENVSDAAVQQMVNQLNTDYRKLNSDLNSARSVVQPFAVDAQIEFCLAQRNPSGQSTNGIEHISTTHGCFDANSQANEMKSTGTGGANPWNPSKYLNIWVVHICGSSPQTGGIAGYSYIPTSNNGLHGSNIDGVVVDYSIGLGSGNRTWTHEVGHYLGLHHTWGDLSGNACGNVFPDTDDGFSDTPDSKDPNYGCTAHTSCAGNSSYGDLFEDYMDYGDGCAVLFTAQQANYMNNILTNVRSSLFNSNLACTPLGGPVASFTGTPTSICIGQSVQFTSTSTGSNLTYNWSFPGGTPTSSTSQNPTVTYNAAGTYNASLTVSSGGQNNTSSLSNYITVSGSNSLPLSEGFETAVPPSGWTLDNADNGKTWTRTTSASGYGSSSASAYMNNYNYSSIGQKDWLITPSYNFSGVNNGRVKWDYAYAPYPQAGYADSLEVLYSTNCGATWTSLWRKGGTSLATATATNSNFVPTANQWKTDSVSLSALNGQSSVRFAFVNTNKYGNNVFLDNVNVYNASSQQGQAPVANFVGVPTTVVVGNTVSFTDLSSNNPTSWSWSFSGGTPSTSSAQNPTITYNTVGTYSVTLTATNSQGSNPITKTNYITVVQGGGTSACDTLSNFVATDTLTIFSFLNGGGYLTGHNQYADKAKAEYYVNPSPGAQVTGALFYFAVAKTLNPTTAHITATVWDNTGTGGSPGTAIATQSVLINSIAQNVANQALTYVSFSSPPTVNSNFYVGFQMTNAAGDTVALVSSTFHSPAPNRAWEQESDNLWYLFDSVYGSGLDIFALPILCTGSVQGPTASFNANKTAVCAGSTVSFTSTSTGNPTSYSWVFSGGTPATSNSANPTVTYNAPGTYNVSLTVSNSNGSNSATQTNYITVYATPILSTGATSVLCFGGNNGSATVNATGGTAPYSYAWGGGGNSATISNKPAGSYSVTVSDAHQCSSTASVNIGQPLSAITLTSNATDAACGQPNGSVSVIASGGAGGFDYSWNTGATTQTVSNLAPGNYIVTVTDDNNCTASTAMTISNQNVSVSVSVNTTAACSGNNGSADAVVTNSTQGINGYQWNTGATSGSINNLAAGNYSVTVMLTNGCSGTATGQVITASGPSASLNPTNGTCQTPPAINLTVNGGSAPFDYAWSNGAITEDVQNIPAGSYSVTITDANGCSASATTPVSDNSTLSVTFSTQDPTSGNNGSITATPSGGTSPYSYSWSNGGNTPTISNLASGTYTVTIMDNSGCIKISSATIVSTDITQVKGMGTIQVFPNPANDICNVMIELNNTEDVQIAIYNSIGQSLYSTQLKNYQSGTEKIDMSSFASGVYLVKVRLNNTDRYIRLLKE